MPETIDELLQQACSWCGMPGLIVHDVDVASRTMTLRCAQCGGHTHGQRYRPMAPAPEMTTKDGKDEEERVRKLVGR